MTDSFKASEFGYAASSPPGPSPKSALRWPWLLGILVCACIASFLGYWRVRASKVPERIIREFIPNEESPSARVKLALEHGLAADKSGDPKRVSEWFQSITLPECEDWFAAVFGSRNAEALSTEYQETVGNSFPDNGHDFWRKLLRQCNEDGATDVHVVEWCNPTDFNAPGDVNQSLRAMEHPVPLYVVDFFNHGRKKAGPTRGFFAIVNGKVRWIGWLSSLQ